MAKKIEIGGVHFKTQKAAKDKTREILLSVEPTGKVTPKCPDWNYLSALIQRHHEYESKVGAGVHCFIVHRNIGNIALSIERQDGSVEDISWVKCITSGGRASFHQNLMGAMRYAVRPQIKAFRERADRTCSICSQPIRPSERHVDHEEPVFDDLAAEFLKENTPPKTFDDDPITNAAVFSKRDKVFETRWQNYHRKFAKLRMTHARCNLSRKRNLH